MIITHTTKHLWYKNVPEDILDCFGKNNRTRLKSTLKRVGDNNVDYKFTPLTEEFFDWFKPKYEETIKAKKNAKVFDIMETTLYREDKRPYFTLSLFENNEPVGGTIFSFLPGRLSVAYRIYNNKWQQADLPANPSLYTEYLITEHAHLNGYDQLSHGQDRNPYGLNSNIGLGLFKLSVGCYPKLPEKNEMTTTDTSTIDSDALIMLPPDKDEVITRAALVTNEPDNPKYTPLFKYKDRLEIEVVPRGQ